MGDLRGVAAGEPHPDQVARAKYQAGADLRSVVAGRLDSAWAWGALAAEQFDSGQAVDAYATAFTGHAVGFEALKAEGWARGDPVPDGLLLACLVLGLAARALGDQAAFDRTRGFVAALGHDLDDRELLESLRR